MDEPYRPAVRGWQKYQTRVAGATGTALARQLHRSRHGHPWTGWSFSAGWGSSEKPAVTLVEPKPVVEVGIDVARDAESALLHFSSPNPACLDCRSRKTVVFSIFRTWDPLRLSLSIAHISQIQLKLRLLSTSADRPYI
ncbi:hypothetical protein WDV06_15290 [Streptomyces racemochromogenes]|uniref:Transposase n=1 Tax=Streptomyces racemochromogenes TaxID=67353 RepID=A0ABW7PDI6_9ACTN